MHSKTTNKPQSEAPSLPAMQPKCMAIAEAGIRNSQDTIRYLSALVADGSAGRVTTGLMHGTCNAIGKLLRVAEMEARFGTSIGSGPEKVMNFIRVEGQDAGVAKVRESALAKLSREEAAALGIA